MCLSSDLTGCSLAAPDDNKVNGGCCMRYKTVGKLADGQLVDLVVQTMDENYIPANIDNNGIEKTQKTYGQISFSTDATEWANIMFALVWPDTATIVPNLEMLKWTFLDFDAQQVNKRQKKKFGEESPAVGEEMRVLLEGDNHVLHEYYTSATATGTTTGANTSLTISEVVEDGKTYLNIRGKESQEDNPEHPLGLTEAQQQVAIGLLFKDTSNFEAEFKLYGVGEGGRNLFFTGASVQTEKGDDCTIITDEDDLPQDNALETRMRQVRDLAINEDASTMACALTEDESAEVKRLYAAADTEVAVAGGANLHHNARAKLGKRIRK
jgi:hypothetical protein